MGCYRQKMASDGEQGCSYAAMILHDDGIEITEEKIKTLLDAAKVQYDSYWPGLYCKALASADLNKIITSPSGGGSAGPAAASGGAAAAGGEAAAEAKKESSSDEADAIPAGPGLFDAGDDY